MMLLHEAINLRYGLMEIASWMGLTFYGFCMVKWNVRKKKRKAVEEKRIKKMVPTDLHLSVDNVLESKFSSMRGAVVH